VRTAAETLRQNPAIDTRQAITELGVGEALVSFLDEKGTPVVVERAFVLPPASRIGPITPDERRAVVNGSVLKGHYEQAVDRESAYERLKARATGKADAAAAADETTLERSGRTASRPAPSASGGGLSDILFGSTGPRGGKREGMIESAARSAARSVGSGLGRQILRGMLGGILGGRR
jgi:hypothetical protein